MNGKGVIYNKNTFVLFTHLTPSVNSLTNLKRYLRQEPEYWRVTLEYLCVTFIDIFSYFVHTLSELAVCRQYISKIFGNKCYKRFISILPVLNMVRWLDKSKILMWAENINIFHFILSC